MSSQDPSLARRDQSGYLRRYTPYGGFHLATCYP